MDPAVPSLNMNSASSPPDTPNEVEKSLYSNRHILSEPYPTNTAHRISEIPHGIIKYWILCCIGFYISAPLMTWTIAPPLGSSTERTVSLAALLVSADPTNSVITFDWANEFDSGCAIDPSSGSLQGPCTDVNIFFDSNLLVSTGNTDSISSSDRPSTPLFRLNATAMATGDIKANSATFRTDIRLFESGKSRRSALINYPFDTGFRTTFTTPVNQADFDDGSEIVLNQINLERGGLIIAFCIIITIAISVVFGFRQRTEVLIIPVATVFAFTQLRASMPGAPPGFGTSYNHCGRNLRNVALTLGALIFTDPTKKVELTWQMIQPEILPALGFKRKDSMKTQKGHYAGA
ncbi:hypothetical protein CVT25_003741 [Psilocybe cyanescens]|uniref:Uncharacterized protein n=1 Tax=Psilocybe cyanescens TaxID=93625 RepID=A0A409XW57_PSICY|nr:hypothetical protein CVT25_003741 [Psilocybe cyanescens]